MSIFAMLMGVGALAIITEHFQKMARIRADGQKKMGRATDDAIESLRQEVAALRDTATQYDLSFDSALQRMELTVAALDRRVAAIERDGPVQTSTQTR